MSPPTGCTDELCKGSYASSVVSFWTVVVYLGAEAPAVGFGD